MSVQGAKDCGHTCLVEEIVVLGGYHTTGSDEDILAAELLELFDHLRHEGLVSGSERAYAEDVDIIFHSLTGSLGRGLEEGPMSTSNPQSA